MDHVVRQRLNEIRQKQLNSLEKLQTTTPSNADNGKSQYLVALGGVAAGLIIAVIVMLAKSIWLTIVSASVQLIQTVPCRQA
jgi:hypothetical protein